MSLFSEEKTKLELVNNDWTLMLEQINESKNDNIEQALKKINELKQVTDSTSVNFLRLLCEEIYLSLDIYGDKVGSRLLDAAINRLETIEEAPLKQAYQLRMQALRRYLDYDDQSYEDSYHYAKQSLEVFDQYGTQREIIDTYLIMSFSKSLSDEEKASEEIMENARARAVAWGNDELISSVDVSLAYYIHGSGETKVERVENLLKASEFYREREDRFMLLEANFAILYNSKSDDDPDLLSRIDEHIKIAKDLHYNTALLSLNREKSVYYYDKEDYSLSVAAAKEALEMARFLESEEMELWVSVDLADALVKEADPEKAQSTLEFLQTSLERAKRIQDDYQMSALSMFLSEHYLNMGNYEKAYELSLLPSDWFFEQEYSRWGRDALVIQSKALRHLERPDEAFEVLKKAYDNMKELWTEDYKKKLVQESAKLNRAALDNQLKLVQMENSLNKAKMNEQNLQLEADHLRMKRAENQLIILILVLGIVLVALVLLLYIHKQRVKVHQQLKLLHDEIEEDKRRLESEHQRFLDANVELREANERLKETDEERKAILGIAAHDMKNPLGAIDSTLSLMRLEVEDEQNSVNRNSLTELINLCEESTEYLKRLIHKILSARRSENHTERLSMRWIDPAVALEQTILMNRNRAQMKGIEIVLEKNAAFEWHCDQQALREILDNLISNSVKYSYPNSQVSIEILVKDDLGLIQIHDSGPGIEEQDFDKLFQPFAKLSAQPTGDEVSTGLGLSSVKTSTAAMNGKIEAENHPEGGAVFSLQFKTKLSVLSEKNPAYEAEALQTWSD